MMDALANSALIVIDVQKGFDDPRWGRRNNPQAEANIKRVLEAWRRMRLLVIHTQHCSTEPNSPLKPGAAGNSIKEIVAPLPGETVLKKNVNSAFIGTDLGHILLAKRIVTVVLVGITTDHCVSTTARMGANMGFGVYVVSDATATFDRTGPDGQLYRAEEVHAVNLVSLHKEFATVIDTETLLNMVSSATLHSND